ncbi:MAG TPA: L,D-transpeptidase, partial [Chloroflexota bacterium]|nr:L,D-transpeptidase [Chloroflexota bacterium]
QVALAAPASAAQMPPGGNKELVVSLSHENLVAYENGQVVMQTLVTSGGPNTPTPLGSYTVLAKRHDFWMHSPWPSWDWRWYADSYVQYALLFQSSGYFIHDASWRGNFGPGSNAEVGTPGGDYTGTHGCVNVPPDAEAFLYSWASIGTTVLVQP